MFRLPCGTAGNAQRLIRAAGFFGPADIRHRGWKLVTLVGPEISIDNLAAASKSTGREVLSHLGRRFHRIYHVT